MTRIQSHKEKLKAINHNTLKKNFDLERSELALEEQKNFLKRAELVLAEETLRKRRIQSETGEIEKHFVTQVSTSGKNILSRTNTHFADRKITR